ncbi:MULTISPECIES: sugar ABC transporter permease [Streptomycetaceae]|uniref:carbohydrate ABC transporter permease n=1 Tax=Streptomycetaceae TaxID=2062 RepID=UPI0009398E74|nr:MULTISPECIES: sugar ABC transporter permease [Streptomycetaceae]MDQ0311465.1 cellobiose transport system permease protein [Kitasatospora herbaricolor]OKI28882.1 ABC transporter permease [Streptomyces sp. CB03911]GGV22148.1 ABC transporter permease [Kitasatospora herbaricolor]
MAASVSAGRPARAARAPVAAHRRHRLDRTLSPYLYIAPFFLVFAGFGLFPMLYTGYVSMTNWRVDVPGSQGQWVGLENYRKLLDDPFFLNALKNTVGIGVLSTVPQLLLALVLAHLLNYRMRGRTLFRLGVLLPNVTSVAAVTLIFVQLFGRDYGLINWTLGLFGVEHIDWQAGTLSSWTAISAIVTWRWTGYNALIFLAAMQAVPFELYEAAAIDGASRWRQFRSITVPMLRPTILFSVIVSTIGALQLFGEPMLFGQQQDPTTGGSQHQFQTLALYSYNQFWGRFKYGYGAAVSWAMFLLIVVIVAANLIAARRMKGLDA